MTKTLIYIIGTGRSGTTILDIMLGNIEDAISLGEINRFYKRSGFPPKRAKTSREYKYWSNIRDQLEIDKAYDYSQLERLFYKNEYHSAFLKSLINFSAPGYKRELNKLYDKIYKNTKEKLIIESSKYPSRALNLSSLELDKKFDIRYIYLKKDPVSVVSSFEKKDLEQPSKGFLNANIYYLSVNILCSIAVIILKLRGKKICTIKYEDLIDNTTEKLQLVQEKLHLDLTELSDKILNETPLNTGYLFDGNRIRLNDTIVLKKQKKIVEKNFKYYFTRVFNYIIYRR